MSKLRGRRLLEILVVGWLLTLTVFAVLPDVGIQGEQGPHGVQGLSGSPGAVGLQGDVGPEGSTGPQGLQGVQGVQGVQGLSGLSGPAGPQGEPGVAGPRGIQGLQGDQGPQGEVGEVGSAGPVGAVGVAGPQGAVGPQGPLGSPLPMPLASVATDKVGYYRGQQLTLYGSGFTKGDLDIFLVGSDGSETLVGLDPVLQSTYGTFSITIQVPDSAAIAGPCEILVRHGTVSILTVPILVY